VISALLLSFGISLFGSFGFAAKNDLTHSRAFREVQKAGFHDSALRLDSARESALPTESLDLELKNVPDLVELSLAVPPVSSGRGSPERTRERPDSQALLDAPRAGGDRSQAAVDQFSHWIGDTPLKAGFADFDDGTRLHFAFREGTGPAVLVVHGRAVGPEGFQRWAADMFPGRPVLFLQRRGYSGESDRLQLEDVHRRNAEDIGKAIDVARKMGGGGKVGILTHSLGAMILPRLDPAKVAWLALLNPGVHGMFRAIEMMPKSVFDRWSRGDFFGGMADLWMKQIELARTNTTNRFNGEMAQVLAGGDWITRWVDPITRAHWIQWASQIILSGVQERLAHMRDADGGLAKSLAASLSKRESNRRWRESVIHESLWASLARTDYAPWGDQIPVFLGTNHSDELIPQFVWERLEETLKPGRIFEAVHQSGAHLHPLFFPQAWLAPLHAFDEKVQGLAGK